MAFPKRTIRRSQVISIFGVGSIYMFKNHYSKVGDQDSLMLAGLDAWNEMFRERTPPSEWKIFEPRLQSILNKEFFLNPPDFRKNSPDKALKMKFLPYMRFPSWHYCHECKNMKKLPTFGDAQKCNPLKGPNGRLIHEKHFKSCAKNNEAGNEWRKKYLIPIRFMVICDSGHIDDFPFERWVHRKNKYIPNECELKFFEGKGGNNSLMNVRVDCVKCNEGYPLAEAFSHNEKADPFVNIPGKYKCTGNKPWLGPNQKDEGCRSKPKVVLRQSSNVYYPVVKSSILIPVKTNKYDRKILEFINRPEYWSLIVSKLNDPQGLDGLLSGLVMIKKLDKQKVLEAIESKVKGIDKQKTETSDDEELYKFQEYNYLKNKNPSDDTDLDLKIKKIPMKDYGTLNNYFSNIFLLESLTETRVQTGFTRLLPYDTSRRDKVQLSSLIPLNWLPGITVKGEGIFFEFKKELLSKWEEKFNSDHLDKINTQYNEIREDREMTKRSINTKFFLIHTFSHLLINQLSYSCGYGSASLRERIYCNLNHPDKEMNGVLIYTASGDSEGSLGGLVREGEPQNIRKVIVQALRKARVCSYDPVCLDNKSQGLNGTNASACHACTFLSETSCEEANQLLDRTTVIGDIINIQQGYFKDLLKD